MKIGWLDPGLEDNSGKASSNLGDLIIQEAVEDQLRQIFGGWEWVRVSTHVPVPWKLFRRLRECELCIVGGTNLLSSHIRRYKQWEVGWREALFLPKPVLLGVGWWQYQDDPDWYTRSFLRSALSHQWLHSTRDDYTRGRLERLGFATVLNTGCPTMWPLQELDPTSVPAAKAPKALTMLTDYNRKPELDIALLRLLLEEYAEVFLWPQGRNDLAYAQSLNCPVRFLEHSMESLKVFIGSAGSFDYIGTRLHGGVYCLRARHRALVLEVDNRAREIARDTGLPTAGRSDFDAMRRWIYGPTGLKLTLPKAAIERWRGQFAGLTRGSGPDDPSSRG